MDIVISKKGLYLLPEGEPVYNPKYCHSIPPVIITVLSGSNYIPTEEEMNNLMKLLKDRRVGITHVKK